MKVLVTGSRGLVGSRLCHDLRSGGHEVVEFDLRDGCDVLDPSALRQAMAACDAVVHAAALLGEPEETAEDILTVNVVGTWNVLSAAADTGIRRLVNLSSVDALGTFKGERKPDYLPLDDRHQCYAATPYGVSKLLGEEACRRVSESRGLTVVCLRPPGVWTDDTYEFIKQERAKRPAFEWDPFWEYGAFIDVRDLSAACLCGLLTDVDGYHCFLVSASDITTSGRTSRELTAFVHPEVEWRGGPEFERDPFRSLIDSRPARDVLGWVPRHAWRDYWSDCTRQAGEA